jgi:hypothetical protein
MEAFKQGDKVKLISKKYPSNWANEWDEDMDQFVGAVGIVVQSHGEMGVEVDFDSSGYNYAYPVELLEIV